MVLDISPLGPVVSYLINSVDGTAVSRTAMHYLDFQQLILSKTKVPFLVGESTAFAVQERCFYHAKAPLSSGESGALKNCVILSLF